MKRWTTWLRQCHVVLLVGTIAAISVYVGGSAVYDSLVHSHAPEKSIHAAIRIALPSEYRNFKIRAIRSPAHAVAGRGLAEVELELIEPLYSAVAFDECASERGDDPEKFERAMALWGSLPVVDRPTPPGLPPHEHAFTIAKGVGDVFSCLVEYESLKVSQGWTVIDRARVWLADPEWIVRVVVFPPPTTEYSGLRTRVDLGRNPLVIGEPQSEEYLAQYIAGRRQFIDEVEQRVGGRLQESAAAAARNAFARALPNSDLFEVKVVATSPTPDARETTRSFVVKMQAEPSSRAFRLAPAKTDAWRRSARAVEFEAARLLSADLGLDVGDAPFGSPVFYEAIPEGTTSIEAIARVDGGSTADFEPEFSVSWIKEPDTFDGDLILPEQASSHAVFADGAAPLYSTERYVADIDRYLDRVREKTVQIGRRWGPDQDAWRLVSRAIRSYGGKDALDRTKAMLELVHGTRLLDGTTTVEYHGSIRTAVPLRVRKDYSYRPTGTEDTRRRKVSAQTFTLDRTGFWQLTDGEMRPDELASTEDVIAERTYAYAQEILLRLAADDGAPFRLASTPSTHGPGVTVRTAGWPDLMLRFDAAEGHLISVSFTAKDTRRSRQIEYRYAGMQMLSGLPRPKSVEVWIDGEMHESRTIDAAQPVVSTPEQFRNPYSPGRPFSGNPNGPKFDVHAVSRSLNKTIILMDDHPAHAVMGPAGHIWKLPAGEHTVAVVVWIPITFDRNYRVVTVTKRIMVNRNAQLFIFANEQGSLDCELR